MKRMLLVFSFFFLTGLASAQLARRILFIGDAGSPQNSQKTLIADAARRVVKGKTTVVFMGDNIYPNGMTPKSGKTQQRGKRILKSQFMPFRSRDAKVIFIPGNRDWNNSRTKGLRRIKKQGRYLRSLKDEKIELLPKKGCPGPVVVTLSDQFIMIVLDTEWWLYPFAKPHKSAQCGATTKKEIQTRLREILVHNKDKTILLVTHHPGETNGNYGGKFSLKDHLFPLTALHKFLYIPLPGIGSLYPLFKKVLAGREELHHPRYTEMNRMITKVFRGVPNVVRLSSHENGLQLIKDSTAFIPIQIIAGIGRKTPYLSAGEHTVFEKAAPGYVMADLKADGSLHFSFFGDEDGRVQKLYEYTKSYRDFSTWRSPVYQPETRDSVRMAIHPRYEERGGMWRFLMGNNYREMWGAPVKFPVFHLSQMKGGLQERKIGGGFQTRNLRLLDSSTGIQYVLRSVEKTPDRVIPSSFRSPFTRRLVLDFYSSQNPYGALVVPPIAQAMGVPHANPVYGYVAPDKGLGKYAELFAGKINLFEPWEPYRPTDNYRKALKKLHRDNDNTFDADNFLKARMLDLIIGDWDRDEDQWRFHDTQPGKHKNYLIVPRDRDMALNLTNGLLVGIGKYFFLKPHVYGFNAKLVNEVNWYMWGADFLNAHWANQLGYKHYMTLVHQATKAVTDSVVQKAVAAMPVELSEKKKETIAQRLKERRDALPAAMKKYYKFTNKIVDIRGTDRKEFFAVKSIKGKDALQVVMRKIDKHGKLQDTLMTKVYPRKMTKEIRLYLGADKDSVSIDNVSSTIKLRIIGGKPRHHSHKSYTIVHSKNKIRIYDYKYEHYYGKTAQLKLKISKAPENTAFIPVNMYNDFIPRVTGGFNRDDGVMFGLGGEFVLQRGFRKKPFRAKHKFMLIHSLYTHAFAIQYNGEWTAVLGKANVFVNADLKAPKNSQNFFGIGNEVPYIKKGNHHSFYRARFDWYKMTAGLKWTMPKGGQFKIGPSVQYYHYSEKENKNRFIQKGNIKYTYDRNSIAKDKWHLGIQAEYRLDRRNNVVIPTRGFYFKACLAAYGGLNAASGSYAQLKTEFSFYQPLNARRTLVLADRFGGVLTAGEPAFYQHAYLGGGDNLLGYRQNRFSGMQALYNNLELRWALVNFGNAFLKGQLGLTVFDDIGRVWVTHDQSHKWHNGVGAGLYVAPAYSLLLDFKMGWSHKEGWYPYVSLGFQF